MTDLRTRKEFIDAIKAALDRGNTLVARDLAQKAALKGHTDVADHAYNAATRLDAETKQRNLKYKSDTAGRAAAQAPCAEPLREGGLYRVGIGAVSAQVEDRLEFVYFTFKVERQKPEASFAPNELLLYRKTGASKNDWKAFAFVADDGLHVRIWAKHKGDKELEQALLALRARPDEYAREYALEHCECPRCGAVLENDCSKASLIGPVCAARWNWPYIKDSIEAQRVLARRSTKITTEDEDAALARERASKED